MKYILCYGDSNTWGRIPITRGRYDFNVRWPGVMQAELGDEYHIYENAVNGRTTVFEDPIEEGRNGRANFEVTMMQSMPVDLVILMLGVNDTKNRFLKEAWDIAWGMDLLVQLVKKSGAGPGGKAPRILVCPPVPMNSDWGQSMHDTIFSERSVQVCSQLPECYKKVAELAGVDFLNTGDYVKAELDGIHMTPESHHALGLAMAAKVKELIG